MEKKCKVGDIAFIVTGKAQSILSTERLVLNCMQRMSGIALTQLSSRLVALKPNFGHQKKPLLISEFAKNGRSLLWRHNHRYGLYDMIMLKTII